MEICSVVLRPRRKSYWVSSSFGSTIFVAYWHTLFLGGLAKRCRGSWFTHSCLHYHHFANLLTPFQNAMPLDTHESAKQFTNFSQLALSSNLAAASESLLMHSSTEAFTYAKSKHPAWITLLSFVRWSANVAKILLLALTVASLDSHLDLHARYNYRPFVFIVVWCIARQVDRNGETVKHFRNCMKVLSQLRTPYCTNMRQCNKRPKRVGAHDNAQIPSLQFSLPTSAPEKCVGL